MAPAPREPSVGAPPYRDAPLTPRRPPAPRARVGLGGCAVVALAALPFLLARGAPTPAPAPVIEHATSLVGGARVMVLFSDRDALLPGVLRVPGEPRASGADAIAAPETFDGNGAAALAQDGEHLLNEHGTFLRVGHGAVRPLPADEQASPLASEGVRVVQRAGDFARQADSAIISLRGEVISPWYPLLRGARDVATDGERLCALVGDTVRCALAASWFMSGDPHAGEMRLFWQDIAPLAGHGAAQLAVAGEVACVRGRWGSVRCARITLSPDLVASPFASRAMALTLTGDVPRATAMALGRDDLCLLGADGRLRCVHGPREDAVTPLGRSALRLDFAMEGVDAVGLTDGLGCARRGGRVDCWGPLMRSGWVVTRDRPVEIEGLDGVTELVARRGMVCALTRGEAWCWGLGPMRNRHPRPVRVAQAGPTDHFYDHADCLCIAHGGRATCWEDFGGASLDDAACSVSFQEEGLSRRVDSIWGRVPFAEAGDYRCALKADGAVACRRAGFLRSGLFSAPLVRGIDDVAEIAMTDQGLACARRRAGDVWCWHDNRSGALTVAEADRSPRVVTLRR